MASDLSSSGPAAARTLLVWRPESSQPNAGQAHAPEPAAELQRDAPAELPNSKMRVEIDAVSGRFVRTLLNTETQEILLKYPSEGQLAFSRAISAYVRAANEAKR